MPEALALYAVLVGCVSLLIWTEWLWDFDQLNYDGYLHFVARPAPPRVIIVAIDEQSLAEVGRWPWPRSVHADLLRKIDAAGARSIGWDILFAEPDHTDPAGDRELRDAIADSGKVVLPVANEQQRLGGPLVELLPWSLFSTAAAGLGHVDRQLDRDAIVRSGYLRAGLGSPRWPSFALALLELDATRSFRALPGLRNPNLKGASPLAWVRDYQIWIAFAGPPGHFARLSAVDVLRERAAVAHLEDAIVLVGATAAGLGDLLPTPVSGDSHPMPGVEVVANELDTLQRGLWILPLSSGPRWILSVGLVLLPTLLYAMVPRYSLFIGGGFLLLTFATSLCLLELFSLWFPPAVPLLVQVAGYALWSWRRLVQTLRYLNHALQRLHAEPAVDAPGAAQSFEQTMDFIRQIVPVAGASIISARGAPVTSWGAAVTTPTDPPGPGEWRVEDNRVWVGLYDRPQQAYLGFEIGVDATLDDDLLRCLRPVAERYGPPPKAAVRSAHEFIQLRIQQVERATERLQFMRAFISGTLQHLAHGVMVASGVGRIILANERAAEFLLPDGAEGLLNRQLFDCMGGLRFTGDGSFLNAVRAALTHGQTTQLSARSITNHDLLVQVSGFAYDPHLAHLGVLVSLADVTELRNSERRRRELMAFLSHDLRSPLSSILAMTGVARLRPERARELEFVERIEKHARRTLELADGFLDLARAQTADARQFRTVDLTEITNSAVDTILDQARARGIAVARQTDGPAPMRGDQDLLDRAVVNLLNNALKYSPHGARVSVTVGRTNHGIECSVSDTGYGIAAADIPGLFEKYQRVGNPKHPDAGGSGLGLAFVKAVVERHGGSVQVVSSPDQGSTFTLHFPPLNV